MPLHPSEGCALVVPCLRILGRQLDHLLQGCKSLLIPPQLCEGSALAAPCVRILGRQLDRLLKGCNSLLMPTLLLEQPTLCHELLEVIFAHTVPSSGTSRAAVYRRERFSAGSQHSKSIGARA